MLTLIEDIILQSESEKQDKNQIWEKFFYNVSDSELNSLQRVRFWIKNFTTRQIFKNIFYKNTILKKKLILKSTILKKKNIFEKQDFEEKKLLRSMTLKKRFFLKSMILTKKVFLKSMILNHIFFVLSDSELKFL